MFWIMAKYILVHFHNDKLDQVLAPLTGILGAFLGLQLGIIEIDAIYNSVSSIEFIITFVKGCMLAGGAAFTGGIIRMIITAISDWAKNKYFNGKRNPKVKR